MKRILFLFVWFLVAGAALACEVTFDPNADVGTGSNTAGPFSIYKDGITATISNGLVSGTQYRVYKGQTITFTSEVGKITKIEFHCVGQDNEQYGPGNFDASVDTYNVLGKIGLWEGSENQVSFTASRGQVRITLIIVTYECGNVLVSPVISPPGGTYYEPIEVSMSCSTTDATIHYTTNGSTPTTASPQYTEPFTLSSDCTVKAVAILDGEVSDVVFANYTFRQANGVASIAEAVSLPDDSVVRFLNPVTVLAQHRNYLFIMDNTGCALIFGDCGQTYNNGDIIPGGFAATKTTYNSEPEFMRPQGLLPAIGNTPVPPEEITADQVGHDLFAHYVHLDNVTISQTDGNNYMLTDEQGNTCAIYFGTMGVSAPTDLSATYEIYAIVGSYGKDSPVYQLLPISPLHVPDISLCDLSAITDGTPLTFNHEAIVLYQYKNYLYLMDDCGYGMVYGHIDQTYHTGDVIPLGWGGIKTTWAGEPEISSPTGFQYAVRNEPIAPELIKLTDVGHQMWAHYVAVNGVRFDKARHLLIDREGNTCPYYPEPPYDVPDDEYIDILAIVTSYGQNPVYQLLIIDNGIIDPPPIGVCCINELLDYPSGQIQSFYCPLTVLYQNGKYLYVMDSCGEYGLMYGDAGGPFVAGDLIEGIASWNTYQNNVQLIPYREWEKTGETDPVEPEELPIEELSQDMSQWYLYFENVRIVVDEDGNTWLEDETGRIKMFDKFQCGIENSSHSCDVNHDGEVNIADVNMLLGVLLSTARAQNSFMWPDNAFAPDATYDVWGFLTMYKNELELYPVKIARHGQVPGNEFDVNGDGEVTIADVNCIIDAILSM
ncbi:MAG: chitobiase/beta-hexosaminidase C-terminal domain-containing protein [Muribaculaceae bacterium]|nr:chitobiase/beta-hexosaminidase C-terminal domain-containing protein [Muribaculaceae bacterium]